jgi:class 3 adenylate cyclase
VSNSSGDAALSDSDRAISTGEPISSGGSRKLPQRLRAPTWPVHRTIVALDMEKSTSRTQPVKEELRRTIYQLLDRALHSVGIRSQHLDRLTDRGDGVLALVRPVDEVPKTLLLDPLIPTLSALLSDYNARVSGMKRPEQKLRLRVVIHAGEVHDDGMGLFGEAMDVAFRLLDAPAVKKALRTTDAPLVLVVSEEIFLSIVSQDYLGIDQSAYHPLVRVRVGGRQRRGWLHVPGDRGRLERQPPPTPKGVALPDVYRALEDHIAKTQDPYDVEAELTKLKERMASESIDDKRT